MENTTSKNFRYSLIAGSNDTFNFNVSKDSVKVTQHDSIWQKQLKLSNLGMLVVSSYIGLSHWLRNIEYGEQYPNFYRQ